MIIQEVISIILGTNDSVASSVPNGAISIILLEVI